MEPSSSHCLTVTLLDCDISKCGIIDAHTIFLRFQGVSIELLLGQGHETHVKAIPSHEVNMRMKITNNGKYVILFIFGAGAGNCLLKEVSMR